MKRALSFVLAAMFVLSMVTTSYSQEDKPLSEMLKGNIEQYYFNTTLKGNFEDVEQQVKDALKKEGFGVITYIDVDATMKKKLDVDMQRYVILGACSPKHAYAALSVEDKIGTMLPCNVVIQGVGEDIFEVAAVNPIASMMAIDNEELVKVALEVTDKLKKVIASLEE